MYARRVLVEPRVVCVRCKLNPLYCPVRGPLCIVSDFVPTGIMYAQRVLAEPRGVCVRRNSNPRWDIGTIFAMWYDWAALCVGLDVPSRIVLLSGLCSCWLCVYLLSLWLCLVGVQLPQVVRALDMC